MIYIKLFEDYYSELSERRKKIYYSALYLENEQPITKEEGFIECEYGESDIISFYFRYDTSEDSFIKFENFLEDNKLQIFSDTQGKSSYEIRVKLSDYKLNKYSEIYKNITKYNL